MAFEGGPREGLPSTPWAERFPHGGLTYVDNDAFNRSLMAPEAPRIDNPKYYDWEGPFGPAPHKAADLDKAFWIEGIQITQLGGIATWEAAALSRIASFGPNTGYISGGHNPSDAGENEKAIWDIYKNNSLRVDETNWLPFFRKDRWLDWSETDAFKFTKYARPAQLPKEWSVDDPDTWDKIKVPLQLANRMVEALIADGNPGGMLSPYRCQAAWIVRGILANSCPHSFAARTDNHQLQTLIWGRIVDWEDVAPWFGSPEPEAPREGSLIILSYSAEQMINRQLGVESGPWDSMAKKTPEEWRERLIKLLDRTLWSFANSITQTSASGYTQTHDRYWPGGGPIGPGSLITISTEVLSTLSNKDSTLQEHCTRQVTLACTMIHELTHAIMAGRMDRDQGYPGNAWDQSVKWNQEEPYIDATGINEIGENMEQAFFGGGIRVKPAMGAGEQRMALPITLYSMEFPNTLYPTKGVAGSAFALPGAATTIRHIPLTWTSQMLSEDFWTPNPSFPWRSQNFFHRSNFLVAQSYNQGQDIPAAEWNSPMAADVFQAGAPTSDMLVSAIWNQRHEIWNAYRAGWWDNAKREWGYSPWGDQPPRAMSSKFQSAFAQRDEARCSEIAFAVVNVVTWDQTKTLYEEQLPSSEDELSGVRWAWHALALLMMASLPIRLHLVYRNTNQNYVIQHTPSRSAAQAGHKFTASAHVDVLDNNKLATRPSEFYTANGDQQVLVPAEHITQLDYLNRIDEIIMKHLVSMKAAVHLDFAWAILIACRDLRADRMAIADQYPNGADVSRWASRWFFQFPEYSPTIVRWNPVTNGFEEMELS
ncbi:hypothetical protein F5Y16DRAFT_417013 [Xylariaceae sp. FL0255]|nr:hypothetical protein F5Y16DRAFT_417013 [Xylariaceae sp. FL0255]